jgi:hypothetical protein
MSFKAQRNIDGLKNHRELRRKIELLSFKGRADIFGLVLRIVMLQYRYK